MTTVNPDDIMTDLDSDTPFDGIPRMPDIQIFDDGGLGVTPMHPNLSLDTPLKDPFVKHFTDEAKGEPIGLRIAPTLVRIMDRVIQNHTTGYETKSDLIRDAIYHLLRVICDMHNTDDPRLRSYLQSHEVSAEFQFEIDQGNQVREADHKFTDYLLSCLERDDLTEAYRSIARHEENIARIPIDAWRNRWADMITGNPIVQQLKAAQLALTTVVTTPGGISGPANSHSPQPV